MKNAGTILLSAGVLLVGFSLLTPLLFFLIAALLDKTLDGSILLQMEYALFSLIGIALLILGSCFSTKTSMTIIISSVVALLSMVGCFLASNPKTVFDWIVIACYYLSLLTTLSMGIAILHKRQGGSQPSL